MISVLDTTLQEVEPRRYTTVGDLGSSILQTLSNPSQRVVHRAPQIPDFARVHGSFLYMLSDAYSLHWDVSISPHDLWYMMLCDIAQQVNASPTNYEDIFTRSPEKIQILVPGTDYLPLDLIIDELRRLVPVDLDLFIPEFSTHNPSSRAACMAAFCDVVKTYYDYGVFCCGIRSVELRGTADDWDMFKERVGRLKNILNMQKWLGRVETRISQIADTFRGGDDSFMKDIFTQKNIGSGSQLEISGWITEFFSNIPSLRKITNFPRNLSVVPFTNVSTNQSFTEVYGCFYSVPETSWHLPTPTRVAKYSNFTFTNPIKAA